MAVAARITSLQRRLEAANHRMSEDLRSAQRAQMALIPPPPPEVAGVRCRWQLTPCDELAGDLLAAFRLDEHHLAFHVIDISGHGVAAALLAVQVARYLTPLASAGSILKHVGPDGYRLTPPAEVPRLLNDIFQRQGSLQFLTMAYGILDLRDFRLSMALSAHPAPILRRANGRIEQPEVTSHPIGMIPTAKLAVSTWETTLEPGDQLLLYSDGATEASGPGGEFGSERLATCLDTPRERPLEHILATVRSWTGGVLADDLSLLLVARS
jgi:sigma-B regulation protein RsbU (phosphoserine phosphatase)